jgi:hypothetical protein
MKLSKFDYIIYHRPGVKNPADGLSRRADYVISDLNESGSALFLNLAAISRLQSINPSIHLCYIVPEVIRQGYAEAI